MSCVHSILDGYEIGYGGLYDAGFGGYYSPFYRSTGLGFPLPPPIPIAVPIPSYGGIK